MITMYRGKWKFSVMSADEAEKFIQESHFERIRFISITEANGHHIDFHKCEGNITLFIDFCLRWAWLIIPMWAFYFIAVILIISSVKRW